MSWREFHANWLCRYPRPKTCLHDLGSEFMGHDFQQPLYEAQIKNKNITPQNPQGNSICERMHLTVAQVLRVLLHHSSARPTNQTEADTLVDRTLAITMHAQRCTASTALLNQTPGSLAFARDMLLDLPFIADFVALQQSRQLKIDKRLLQVNSKRIPHDFAVNDNVYVRTSTADYKLDDAWEGPFPIRTVHTNGTVTFERPNGIWDRQNVRKLKPAK